jgi:hypothetical protein
MELIEYLALGWLIANFEPLHWVIDYIFIQVISSSKLGDYIHSKFGCWKCMSFWTTLALSGNIYTAAITAMGAYIISEWIESK